jgi:hypothetical protein
MHLLVKRSVSPSKRLSANKLARCREPRFMPFGFSCSQLCHEKGPSAAKIGEITIFCRRQFTFVIAVIALNAFSAISRSRLCQYKVDRDGPRISIAGKPGKISRWNLDGVEWGRNTDVDGII